MKSAKEILMGKATKNNDGFTSGQPRWIIEAMEEYAAQFRTDKIHAIEIVRKLQPDYDKYGTYGHGFYDGIKLVKDLLFGYCFS